MTNEKRNIRTIAYFLIVGLTIVVGVAITLSARTVDVVPISTSQVLISVGTGVLAAGLASLALGIMRWIDDKDADEGAGTIRSLEAKLNQKLDSSDARMGEELGRLRDLVGESGAQLSQQVALSRFVAAKYAVVNHSPSLRCVSDAHIGSEFRRTFHAARDSLTAGQTMKVDVLGLKLHRFLNDQFTWLQNRGPVEVRLLLQHPQGSVFEAICQLEGRDVDGSAKDVRSTLARLKQGSLVGSSWETVEGDIKVSLRFTNNYQPVTLFRIEGACCVRPRVSTPLGAATRFYERYDTQGDPAYFSVYAAHFEQAWRTARFVNPFKDELRT